MSNTSYLYPTEEAGKDFFLSNTKGPVVMLNLLKFKKIADYSNLQDIAPENEISGEEAYEIYVKHTLPFLKDIGSEVLFKGKGGTFLIGPKAQNWDLVLLVRHADKQKFLGFASNKEYLKIAGHRTAALEDSRLLPIIEEQL